MSSTLAFMAGVAVGAVGAVLVWPWVVSHWRAARPLPEFKARLAAYAATHLSDPDPARRGPDLWNPTGTSSTATWPEGDLTYTMAPVWADLADEFDEALWETLDDEADADADEGADEDADGVYEFDEALWETEDPEAILRALAFAEDLPDDGADEFNPLPDGDRLPYGRPTLTPLTHLPPLGDVTVSPDEFNPAPVEALTVLDGVTMAEAVPPDVPPDRRDMVASALREFNRR